MRQELKETQRELDKANATKEDIPAAAAFIAASQKSTYLLFGMQTLVPAVRVSFSPRRNSLLRCQV
jgi:hypothetical protein